MKKIVSVLLCGLFVLSVVVITGCPQSQVTRPDQNYRGETISYDRFEVVNGSEDAAGLGMSGAAADTAEDAAAGGEHSSH